MNDTELKIWLGLFTLINVLITEFIGYFKNKDTKLISSHENKDMKYLEVFSKREEILMSIIKEVTNSMQSLKGVMEGRCRDCPANKIEDISCVIDKIHENILKIKEHI